MLHHKLQSFLWWLLFSTTDTVSKFKCFIHHPLKSTAKISSSVISSGASAACPVGLPLRSAANYLPLCCTGATVGKKKNAIKKCSVKQHAYNKTFLCIHTLKCLWISLQIQCANYINLNTNFHGLIKFLLIKRLYFLEKRDSSLYQLLCEWVTTKDVCSSVYSGCSPVLLTPKVGRGFLGDTRFHDSNKRIFAEPGTAISTQHARPFGKAQPN